MKNTYARKTSPALIFNLFQSKVWVMYSTMHFDGKSRGLEDPKGSITIQAHKNPTSKITLYNILVTNYLMLK